MSLFAIFALCFGGLALVVTMSVVVAEPTLRKKRMLHLGIVSLSGAAAYKLLAFLGILVLPGVTMAAAHADLLEGAKSVESCGKCHVMTPMVTDMTDPASDSLAARHFKNRYIEEDQCYHCHSGYGFNGALAAKLEGYRHLVRYTTGTYEEPIEMRARFDVQSCFKCHLGTQPFEAVNSHRAALSRLSDGQMSCVNCHGPAHPTRTERTPGSPSYARLMARETESASRQRHEPVLHEPDLHEPDLHEPDLRVHGPVDRPLSTDADAGEPVDHSTVEAPDQRVKEVVDEPSEEAAKERVEEKANARGKESGKGAVKETAEDSTKDAPPQAASGPLGKESPSEKADEPTHPAEPPGTNAQQEQP